MTFKEKINWKLQSFIKIHFPFYWSKSLYRKQFGTKVNFNNPKDLNEKILWLMFYSDISLWTILADKYAVRDYVRDRIGEQYLIPLLGVWSNEDDIDFDKLPDSFALKPNNGSYDCILCTNKNLLDFDQIKKQLHHSLKFKFGYENAEPHYTKIKPQIIAEKLLESDSEYGLIDYKIWCFNGQPYCFFICINRDLKSHHAVFLGYDLDWNPHPEWFNERFRSDKTCPKPKNLKEMLNIASKLSKGLPQARVDLYNVDGQIFFGEMTMSSNFGMMPYYNKSTLIEMGNKCILPERSFQLTMKTFSNRHFPKF